MRDFIVIALAALACFAVMLLWPVPADEAGSEMLAPAVDTPAQSASLQPAS
ncbi:hypothetical protein [Henriciella aquimarina]|uniref:hypothetical protein n=1 Tax=Henriciella aquimarina TaxID=545261 RepID=UPI001301AF7C|nr:hypothetical protein [Henriciella aquimarina]